MMTVENVSVCCCSMYVVLRPSQVVLRCTAAECLTCSVDLTIRQYLQHPTATGCWPY